MIRPCDQCGVVFGTDDDRRKYCSVTCYRVVQKLRKGGAAAFKKGMTPWNKGKKGDRNSPETEFKKGRRSHTWVPVGTETMRIDKSGKPRIWIKVEEGRKMRPRAQVVWERANGRIPAGYVVHHKNRNTTDDELSNLELISRSNHAREHAAETHAKRKAITDNTGDFGDCA